MALEQCPTCGVGVAENARKCPQCGAPRGHPSLKADSCLVWAVTIVILASIVICVAFPTDTWV